MPTMRSNARVTKGARTSASTRRIRRVEFTPRATEASPPTGWKPAPRTNGVLRHSRWDALFVGLAVVQGTVLLAFPSMPVIALGLWWNANTISHNFIHLPFFRARSLNMVFSAFESLVLGIPQRLWRDRHLAHHADKPSGWRWSRQLALDSLLVLVWRRLLLTLAPTFLLTRSPPG